MDVLRSRILTTVLCVYVCGPMAIRASGDTNEELLSKIAEAHRRIQSVHVIYSIRTTGEDYTDVDVFEWAMKGEKRYRKKRYRVDLDAPEGSEKRWGKCMWDGKLLRYYDSVSDNGAILRRYNRFKGAATFNAYCRHFGTLMGITLLSLIERLSADDWDIVRDEEGQKVILATDDVGHKDEIAVHRWEIDLNRGGMISRYQVDIKRDNGLQTVSDMRVLEWRDMGNGIWLPSRSTTKTNVPGAPVLEGTVILSKAEVNDELIDRFFVDWDWPKGCQYYDETLDATVIPHATEENMQLALDEFAVEAVSDIDSTLSQKGEVVRVPSSLPGGSDKQVMTTNGRSASYWRYLAPCLGLILIVSVCLYLWKCYKKGRNVQV